MATPVLEKTKDWTVRDYQAGKQLSFHLYNGNHVIQIRNTKDKSPRPMFSRTIKDRYLPFYYQVIDRIMKSSPETKISIKDSDLDASVKPPVNKLMMVVTFEKDGRGVYKIHVSDVLTNQTHSFVLKGTGLISVGNDPMSDAEKSAAELVYLREWLGVAKNIAPFTYLGPQIPGRNGNGGGNNRGGYGGGNGGYGGGNRQQQPSNDGGSFGGGDDGGEGGGLPF